MNGLRIYVDLEGVELTSEGTVFYSRRADGPYYEWRFEKRRGRWLGARLHAAELSPARLTIAPWKGVPSSLKSRLNEHYLE